MQGVLLCTYSKLIVLFVLLVMIIVAAAVVLATDDMMVCYFDISNITNVEKTAIVICVEENDIGRFLSVLAPL